MFGAQSSKKWDVHGQATAAATGAMPPVIDCVCDFYRVGGFLCGLCVVLPFALQLQCVWTDLTFGCMLFGVLRVTKGLAVRAVCGMQGSPCQWLLLLHA